MPSNQLLLLLSLSLNSIISFSQALDERELVGINLNCTNKDEISRVKHRLTTFITIMGLKGSPTKAELSTTDPTYSVVDSARITLTNGTYWNPTVEYNCKKSLRSVINFFRSKELTSTENDLVHYMLFSSQWEKKGYPYYLVDNIFFRYNYFNSKDDLLLQIEFVNRPISKDSIRSISSRKLIYPQ